MLAVFFVLVIAFLSVQLYLSPVQSDPDGKIPPPKKGTFNGTWLSLGFWQLVFIVLLVLIHIEISPKFPVWRWWILIIGVLLTLVPTWLTVRAITRGKGHLRRPVARTLLYASLPMFFSSAGLLLLCIVTGNQIQAHSHSFLDGMITFMGTNIVGSAAIMYFIQGTVLFRLLRRKRGG